jgi:hypothetical protein
MIQATVVMRDRLGNNVADLEFATMLAKAAGFVLLAHITPLSARHAGQWEAKIPDQVMASVKDTGPVSVVVDFPNTEIPIGMVAVYEEEVSYHPLLLGMTSTSSAQLTM